MVYNNTMCRLFKRVENDIWEKNLLQPFFGAVLYLVGASASAQHEIGVRFHTVNFMWETSEEEEEWEPCF